MFEVEVFGKVTHNYIIFKVWKFFFRTSTIVGLASIAKYSTINDRKNGMFAPGPHPNSKTRNFGLLGNP